MQQDAQLQCYEYIKGDHIHLGLEYVLKMKTLMLWKWSCQVRICVEGQSMNTLKVIAFSEVRMHV
jgi:hypothetical protein